MAEQTPDGNGDKTDFLERRQRQIDKKEGAGRPSRGSGSLPPQRGVLKKIRNEDSALGGAPQKREPMTREQMQRQQAKAKGRTRRPSRGDFIDPAAERGRLERKLALEKAEKDRQMAAQAPTSDPAADEKKRQEEEEQKKQAQEAARLQAQNARQQKEKEAAEKKAEAERKFREREEARRVALEERRKREKEEELKRIEEEKKQQEKDRQRIFEKIEVSKGKLNDEDREKAIKIADEMVKRGIKWDGYISLSGGIGGSMLR
jgi:hypothetical protein